MSLTELSNLSTLLICGDGQDGGLTPVIVRNWGHHARDHGSFAKLSLLMLDSVYGSLGDYLDAVAMLPVIKVCYMDNRYSSAVHKQMASCKWLSRDRWERLYVHMLL